MYHTCKYPQKENTSKMRFFKVANYQSFIYVIAVAIVIAIVISVFWFIKNKTQGKANKNSSETSKNPQRTFAITIPGFS